jgi:hypothetical protein
MHYRIKVERDNSFFVYPVPNVEDIRGAKYDRDATICVCEYPTQLPTSESVIEITQAEYDKYPMCLISNAPTEATATVPFDITVSIPELLTNDRIYLNVNNKLVDFVDLTTGVSHTFALEFDTTMQGEVVTITASSDKWATSQPILIKVV